MRAALPLVLLLSACAPVTGTTGPCEAMQCDYSCLRAGGTSGVCRDERCVCTGVDAGADASVDVVTIDAPADAQPARDVAGEVGTEATVDVLTTDVSSERLCGGVFTNTMSDPINCGRCGMRCDSLRNVRPNAGLCVAGLCEIDDACRAGWANCNDERADGCEAQASLPTRCGSCGRACNASTPMCQERPSGSGDPDNPTVYVCTNGCDPATPDRCLFCTDTRTDTRNCGGCGRSCSGRCVEGRCL